MCNRLGRYFILFNTDNRVFSHLNENSSVCEKNSFWSIQKCHL